MQYVDEKLMRMALVPKNKRWAREILDNGDIIADWPADRDMCYGANELIEHFVRYGKYYYFICIDRETQKIVL